MASRKGSPDPTAAMDPQDVLRRCSQHVREEHALESRHDDRMYGYPVL